MLTLCFVRHGETEWNVANRIQGQLDSRLTDEGILNVLKLKQHIHHVKWLDILSSPSGRALQTAKLLFPQQAIKTDERLLEMHLGIFEGLTWEEMKMQNHLQYNYYWNYPNLYSPQSGENFYDVKKRVADFLEEMIRTYDKGNVLIVTHGVIIKLILLIVNKNDINDLWSKPHVEGATITAVQVIDNNMSVLATGEATSLNFVI